MTIEALDAARRALNAARRMRKQAVRSARPELVERVDEALAEDEALIAGEVEMLLRSVGAVAEA